MIWIAFVLHIRASQNANQMGVFIKFIKHHLQLLKQRELDYADTDQIPLSDFPRSPQNYSSQIKSAAQPTMRKKKGPNQQAQINRRSAKTKTTPNRAATRFLLKIKQPSFLTAFPGLKLVWQLIRDESFGRRHPEIILAAKRSVDMNFWGPTEFMNAYPGNKHSVLKEGAYSGHPAP